jgi:hypothetical protein
MLFQQYDRAYPGRRQNGEGVALVTCDDDNVTTAIRSVVRETSPINPTESSGQRLK